MAGVKISNLPAAGAITGTELVAVVQGGVTSQTTTAAVAGATGVSTFSAGTTGLTPASATAGAISLAGTLAVANGGTGVTTSTGTGSTVRSASPTFTGTLAAAAVSVTGVSTLTGGAIVQGLTVGKGGNSVATNTAMGDSALLGNVGGSINTAIGWYALAGNTSGGSNTALGYGTLAGNLTTSNNTAIGSNALQISTGTSNLAIGAGAGSALTTGSNNTIIGSVPGTAGLEATVIIAAGSAERMRIDSSGNVGIGGAPSGGPFNVRTSIASGAFSAGIQSTGQIQSAVSTRADMFLSAATCAAGTYAQITGYQAQQGTFTGTVTNQIGFKADSSLTGATNNFGFYGNIASGTGRYNLYMAGTATNYLAGDLAVNTKVIVGGPTSATGAFGVQIYGDATTFAPATTIRGFSNTAGDPSIFLIKTRGTTATSFDLVANDDGLGKINFLGSNGTTNSSVASIYSAVGNSATYGAASATSIPSLIGFVTTPTGSVAGLLRMQILPNGAIAIFNVTAAPATSPANLGQLYVEAGALKYRGSSGTVTTIAAA